MGLVSPIPESPALAFNHNPDFSAGQRGNMALLHGRLSIGPLAGRGEWTRRQNHREPVDGII